MLDTGKLYEKMPFARVLGVRLLTATPELVEAEMLVRPDLCTAGGQLHGGAAMSFSDSLGGVGAWLALPEGAKGTVTVESKTNLLGAAMVGETITARTTPVHGGRRLQVWQTMLSRPDGAPVAMTVQTQMTL
ncbi:MAG: PaaI family thioesterase [Paracoccaceae bacterium]